MDALVHWLPTLIGAMIIGLIALVLRVLWKV